ncbi:hypothetical protein CAPTEDRAFT_213890 [Capitella teleta]|uniref:Uncharacterized protein n=1 Tax=Capitella teleta TaxID=283909 RepID=R7TCU2_CAPTE|nr:hypothetical protein CAPTEDRAFT_213890 [Capitella teleta]|eukprot:ELT89292.1 hypothetical protein CAPTEDRAFT_213890 [Capitella teleta]
MASRCHTTVALLLHTIGNDALRIYNGFTFTTEEDQRTITEIFAKFEEFAVGAINITYERYVFNQRIQERGEAFDNFLSDLRELIKSCNFCTTCVDSVLRDRIVTDIKKLRGAGNIPIDCLGTFQATLSYEEHSKEECIYVIRHQSKPLLSRRACASLGLLSVPPDLHESLAHYDLKRPTIITADCIYIWDWRRHVSTPREQREKANLLRFT